MPYIVLIHATFETKAAADHIYDQAMTVATHASVARIGKPGERTSWGGVFVEDATGEAVRDRSFHIDRFGIVRPGKAQPDDEVVDWVQPQGAQDAYPLVDIWGGTTTVRHNGQLWLNTTPNNTWEPGAPGTESLWAVL